MTRRFPCSRPFCFFAALLTALLLIPLRAGNIPTAETTTESECIGDAIGVLEVTGIPEHADAPERVRIVQRDSIRVAPVAPGDSLPYVSLTSQTSVSGSSDIPWYKQLKQNHFNLQDTTIAYPRFIGFCVKVYNWADKFFNGYDPDYVQGTGMRWKAYVKNDNWLDSYLLSFDKMNMRMMSNMTVNVGPYLQYMAVSVGYQWDLSNLIGGQPSNRRRFDVGFTCARFCASMYYWLNTGGTIIRSFGKYNNGHLIRVDFPGAKISSLGVEAYYIFNNHRYSHNAAYGFGRIQKKSAGSFIAGFTYANQDIELDFAQLPAVLEPYLTITPGKYTFRYSSYSLEAGYGHNLVFAKNFLFNFCLLPAVGLLRCTEDSVEGAVTLLSLNLRASLALVYNYKRLFAGVNARLDGHTFNGSRHKLFNAMETFTGCIGVRF